MLLPTFAAKITKFIEQIFPHQIHSGADAIRTTSCSHCDLSVDEGLTAAVEYWLRRGNDCLYNKHTRLLLFLFSSPSFSYKTTPPGEVTRTSLRFSAPQKDHFTGNSIISPWMKANKEPSSLRRWRSNSKRLLLSVRKPPSIYRLNRLWQRARRSGVSVCMTFDLIIE